LKERNTRLLGRTLICIGVLICLIPVSAVIIEFVNFNGAFFQLSSNVRNLIGFIFPGFIVASVGVIVLRGFGKAGIFVTKGGEFIHSAKVWKKGTESGLYLTSCGLVVSINQASEGTAHVGYRIATARGATCRDCRSRDGRIILDSAVRRETGLL